MNSKNISETSSYNYFVTVLLLTFVGFVIRYHGLSEWAFTQDDIWHYHVANQKNLLEVFIVNFEIDGHPPFAYFIWYFLNNIFGFNEMAIRMPAMIAGLAIIPASYFLGKEIFKTKNAGLFFAIFLAFSDIMSVQSQVVRGYTISLLFIVLAMLSCFKFQKSNKSIHLFLYYIFAFLAVMSEFAVAPILVFTSLATLKTIYENKQSRLLNFISWFLINISLLVSIAFIIYLTKLLGGLSLTEGTFENSSYSITNKFLYYLIEFGGYFLNFIYQTSFLSYLSKSQGIIFGFIIILEFSFFLTIFFLGITTIIKKRYYVILFSFLSYLIFIVVCDISGLIPADLARRNVGFYIILVTINYIGFIYFVNKFRLDYKFLKSSIFGINSFIIIICLSAIFLSLTNDWRRYYPNEFIVKKSDIEQAKEFLDNNVKKNDIVFSDWLTSLFFKYYIFDDFLEKEKSIQLSSLNSKIILIFPNHPFYDLRIPNQYSSLAFFRTLKALSIFSYENTYIISITSGMMLPKLESEAENKKIKTKDPKFLQAEKSLIKLKKQANKKFVLENKSCKNKPKCKVYDLIGVYSISRDNIIDISNEALR